MNDLYQNEELFNKFWTNRERLYPSSNFEEWKKDVLFVILDDIIKENKKKELRFLDVGCGLGSNVLDYSKKLEKPKVFLIDLSKKVISMIHKELTTSQNKYVKSKQASALKIPFQDNYFDFVFSNQVNHYFKGEDRKKAFSELYRVCKPKGHVFICVGNKYYIPWQLTHFFKDKVLDTWIHGHMSFYSYSELKKFMTGFKLKYLFGIGNAYRIPKSFLLFLNKIFYRKYNPFYFYKPVVPFPKILAQYFYLIGRKEKN
ncbi:MAG: class I SAM-dependent methyltransferase [DPANN group archaeon]|nr:class I SAM-dependent methyltransferase [DPANN group archaeon]